MRRIEPGAQCSEQGREVLCRGPAAFREANILRLRCSGISALRGEPVESATTSETYRRAGSAIRGDELTRPAAQGAGERVGEAKAARIAEGAAVWCFVLVTYLGWQEQDGNRLPPLGALIPDDVFPTATLREAFGEVDDPRGVLRSVLNGDGRHADPYEATGDAASFAMLTAATGAVGRLQLPRSETGLLFGPPLMARRGRRTGG